MTIALHEERSSVKLFGDPDWHANFGPGRIAILPSDGTVVGERIDPQASFVGHEGQRLGTRYIAFVSTAMLYLPKTRFERSGGAGRRP
jgi:hypothetical protein